VRVYISITFKECVWISRWIWKRGKW